MARLHPKTYELPPYTSRAADGSYIDFRQSEHHKAFEELRSKHEMVSFGVADGMAQYIVKSRKPLVLQHVDYCDGYQIPYAMLRGLRLADVEDSLRRSKLGFKF
jgi:hypothetical protein